MSLNVGGEGEGEKEYVEGGREIRRKGRKGEGEWTRRKKRRWRRK